MVNFFSITGNHLRGIFTNPLFKKKLKQIRKYDKEDFEASLDVCQLFKKPDYEIQNIELGFSDIVDRESIEVSTKGLVETVPLLPFENSGIGEEWMEEYYYMISLHNHPGGSFMPSDSDLSGLNHRKIRVIKEMGISVKPIEAIIAKNSDRGYCLLMFQESNLRAVDRAGIREVYGKMQHEIGDEFDPDSVLEALKNQDSYKAEILTLEKNNSFLESDLEKLSNFEFTPEIVDMSRYEKRNDVE
jgi:hypothetical protein